MKPSQFGLLSAVIVFLQLSPLPAETVRLRSGKEVEIIDGALTAKGAAEVLQEASDWLKKGRLDYARDHWKLLIEKGRGVPASRAKAARERLQNVEFESFVILGNDRTLRGKIKTNLRSDLLGLEGKDEIPIWRVEEIAAQYHPGLSQVSRTFYPLTLLEIKLREKRLRTSRITSEIEFIVEGADGSVAKAILGKDYELLRPEALAGQLEAIARDRIIKIVMYPGLIIPE